MNGVCGETKLLGPGARANSPNRYLQGRGGLRADQEALMRQLRDRIRARHGAEEGLLSQQSGATAVVTDEAQVPMMAETLSTSISLRAARTPASGLVWSSSR